MATTSQDGMPPRPILTAHLFPTIEARLIELLRGLTPEDWEKQTISPKWKVKDVTAHLLDTQLRKLAIVRDGGAPEPAEIRSPSDLVALVNRLNEEGVRCYRRLSPSLLISMMEMASRQSAEFHQSLDPQAPARFAVSWAGEEASPNWFDTAREFTERWHHQQQIRLAVDRPGIMTPELYHPVLECFMRGLPHAYRDVVRNQGAWLRFDIAGECGGTWFLHREGNSWRLGDRASGPPTSGVTIPQEIAWRIFTKGITREAAVAHVRVDGDQDLGIHVLGMTTIVG
ncbi:MAG TPA: maleylpyruvate isomerase N-terminal domain-containing protein [Vicinamibacteria bacterium]|jgi:uncharacterized protein (TIGR03083 family)|nr:maleylpyruvate isomerase N-terminal domain-containing protein [Vicinamibacteria bacterium]